MGPCGAVNGIASPESQGKNDPGYKSVQGPPRAFVYMAERKQKGRNKNAFGC